MLPNRTNIIAEGTKIAQDGFRLEKQELFCLAAKKYKEAKKKLFEFIQSESGDNENKAMAKLLSARCAVGYGINSIKYLLEDRKIENTSIENIIQKYIIKMKNIVEKAGLEKVDEYDLLIVAYKELEKFFDDNFLKHKADEMYYERTKLYSKFYKLRRQKNKQALEKLKTETVGNAVIKRKHLKRKIKEDLFKSIVRWIFHRYCGHGERPLRAVIISVCIILAFSLIYYSFGLISPPNYTKTLYPHHSIYFSVVTILGFGDITPINGWGQLMVVLEVTLGYLMLSALIAIIIRKIIR